MAKNKAPKAGKDFVTETITSFVLDKETGHYRKIIRDAVRERIENKLNRGKEIISESMYAIANSSDYDEKFGYDDFDGNEVMVYLKELPPMQNETNCGTIDTANTEV
tara:strand:- start:187 stop:507 length:321 start_codon:yes stop_codon:yes gene_type:complete